MNTKHLLEIDDNLTKAVNEIEFMVGERTEIAHKHILIAQQLVKNLSLPDVSKSVNCDLCGNTGYLIAENGEVGEDCYKCDK
tara:strand:+ start:438 stop:683 length:246 start_codon:yes stop_codon:yes gene_type:complete